MLSLPGGLASMSSYHSKGSAPCLGIDADPQTSFRTSSGDLAWLRVDLGVTRCVWNVNIICSNLTSNGEYQRLAFKMCIHNDLAYFALCRVQTDVCCENKVQFSFCFLT